MNGKIQKQINLVDGFYGASVSLPWKIIREMKLI